MSSWGSVQDALFVSFATDEHLSIGELEIADLKSQDLAGTQAIRQHQTHQSEIAEGTEVAPESGDLFV